MLINIKYLYIVDLHYFFFSFKTVLQDDTHHIKLLYLSRIQAILKYHFYHICFSGCAIIRMRPIWPCCGNLANVAYWRSSADIKICRCPPGVRRGRNRRVCCLDLEVCISICSFKFKVQENEIKSMYTCAYR